MTRSRYVAPSTIRILLVGLAGVLVVACGSARPQPAPPSRLRVASVLLVPAEPTLRASCVRAAAVGGFPVPCPRLIIEHRAPKGESCPDHDITPLSGGKDCLEDSRAGNPALPARRDAFTYAQNDIVFPGALHLFVVGVKADSRLAPVRAGCPGPETNERGPGLDGITTTWVECPDGSAMNSGHVLLRWTRGGVIYAVSLHGHNSVNREVELAIAQHIDYVAP